MNHKNHGNQGRPGMTATPVEPIRQMKIEYGHDDKGHVVVTFNQPPQHLLLTPAQAEEMIEAIQFSMVKLADFETPRNG